MRQPLRTLAALCLGVALAPTAFAQQADLNVSPKRVVFDAATRTATVFVFNRGDAAASYAVDVVERAMLPDGRILDVAEADVPGAPADLVRAAGAVRAASAKPMITFTPRRVTLQPGQSQTIRVRMLRPADLAPGEYRAHLTIATLPPEDAGLTAEAAAVATEGRLAVRIVTLYSLGIPLIARQGDATATADATGLRLVEEERRAEDGGVARTSVLVFDLARHGAGSVYGNLEVRSAREAGGEALGLVRGIAVYPEVDRREIRIPLRRRPARGERLTLRFVDDDRTPGTPLADASLVVP